MPGVKEPAIHVDTQWRRDEISGVVPAVSAVTIVPNKSNLRPQSPRERTRVDVPIRKEGHELSEPAGQGMLAICAALAGDPNVFGTNVS